MQSEKLNWLAGPLSHLHIRFDGEVESLVASEKRQFTHSAAIEYMIRLAKSSGVRLTDTNHAMLSIDVDSLERPKNLSLEEWTSMLVYLSSRETEKRISKIKQNFPLGIIVGVEVDIIDETGKLSLDQQSLDQIDYVIASFHPFIWKKLTEKRSFSPEYLINLYLAALDNPDIDVLGHPTRVKSSKLTRKPVANEYLAVIKKMKEKRVAFEVNILTDLSSDRESLLRDVVKLCVQEDTYLVLSLDFHDLSEIDFLNDLDFSDEISAVSVAKIFSENYYAHYRILRRLIKNIKILKKLGVTQEMVVNNSNDDFDNWLEKRQALVSAL